MNLFDILANPGVGNLFLIIAAVIGVYGSYRLYKLRLDNQRSATRQALIAEIESTSLLDTWVREEETGKEPPAQLIHPTVAYEGHIENIGLLTDEEIEIVSKFYSKAIHMNDMSKWNRESDLRISLTPNAHDKSRAERVNAIRSELDRLAVHRWKAIQILKKHIGDEYESIEKMELPKSAGDTVSRSHPALIGNLEKLVEEGYFEPSDTDPQLYRLTEDGEEFLYANTDFNEKYDLDNELSLN